MGEFPVSSAVQQARDEEVEQIFLQRYYKYQITFLIPNFAWQKAL